MGTVKYGLEEARRGGGDIVPLKVRSSLSLLLQVITQRCEVSLKIPVLSLKLGTNSRLLLSRCLQILKRLAQRRFLFGELRKLALSVFQASCKLSILLLEACALCVKVVCGAVGIVHFAGEIAELVLKRFAHLLSLVLALHHVIHLALEVIQFGFERVALFLNPGKK